MSGLQKASQFGWLVLTIALVCWHFIAQDPLGNTLDAATLLGLVALSIQATIKVWRWSDLALRKLLLWTLNSSVSWTLEVRAIIPEPIESHDIDLLAETLRESLSYTKLSVDSRKNTISIDTPDHYSVEIRPAHSTLESSWVIRFSPVLIGFRDATRLLQRKFLPIINNITSHFEEVTESKYAIEARFKNTNPYAAVLLNELRADSTDKILIAFTQDGNSVQVTKNSIVSSCNSESDAIHTISTVFGLSLRGALSASNI